jgi:hypothetical protein
MSSLSIKEVELQISQTLQPSLEAAFQQAGYMIPGSSRLCVSLVDASGRKKRSNAKADNWSPDSGWLQVWFEHADADGDEVPVPTETPAVSTVPMSSVRTPVAKTEAEPGLAAVIKALARAEGTPGWSFVSLKKFRDEILPEENSQPLQSPIDQRHFLGYAINNRLITVGRVANPKDPRFPVTTIRLNRFMPLVQEILGEEPQKDLGFHPIHIKGEPLSAIILRERR